MLHGNKIQLDKNINDRSHSTFSNMKNVENNCSNTFLLRFYLFTFRKGKGRREGAKH